MAPVWSESWIPSSHTRNHNTIMKLVSTIQPSRTSNNTPTHKQLTPQHTVIQIFFSFQTIFFASVTLSNDMLIALLHVTTGSCITEHFCCFSNSKFIKLNSTRPEDIIFVILRPDIFVYFICTNEIRKIEFHFERLFLFKCTDLYYLKFPTGENSRRGNNSIFSTF